ncbi:hypothetical protein MnTg02_00730 [bacterium MnTg02]|nr:hypothetical protein MnTg02_00730 [bacterium MnTg02]
MITLGAIGFLQPWILVGLASLPAIWWLLRFTPPRPKRVWFPPTRLLKDLESKEQTPAHSPWWLTALRILLVTLIILSLAGPVLNPDRQALSTSDAAIIIVDNGWASANDWDARRSTLDTLIGRANRASQPIVLAATAGPSPVGKYAGEAPGRVQERASSLQPQPFAPDRLAVAKALEKDLKGAGPHDVFWLSDGLDYGKAQAFAERLNTLKGSTGRLTIFSKGDVSGVLGVRYATDKSGRFKAEIVRPGGGAERGMVQAWSGRGARLGEASFAFEPDKKTAEALFDLPLELRNQIARLEVAGEKSAGAVQLLDSRAWRRRIGLVSGESRELSQPLLSPLYYIERAIGPFAEILTAKDRNVLAAVGDFLRQNSSIIILADIGKVVGQTYEQLNRWINNGGLLVRFAGPRLEETADDLLPVALRLGGRALGGALSWSSPQTLMPFEKQSPFYGLQIAKDVTVNRQVLADPTRPISGSEVWARLQDGTPLVTARRRKQGWIVLFHVTANSDWSNLPLSGLFVDMLRRLVDLSGQLANPAADEGGQNDSSPSNWDRVQVLAPYQSLDGFGRLSAPPPSAEAINIRDLAGIKPTIKHPPGYYGPAGAVRALNVIGPKTVLRPYKGRPAGAIMTGYTASKPLALKSWLLFAAFVAFLLDAIAVIALSSGFRTLVKGAGTACLALALSILLLPERSFAQSEARQTVTTDFALKASLKTRFAYVITGDEATDRVSRLGLQGLSYVLSMRTAVEPAEPMAVDVVSDELAFFPLLYWPIRSDAKALPEPTLAKIDAFMKQGGMIIFDTRDYQMTTPLRGQYETPGNRALQRILGRLDIPRLEPVPQGHVLTKSFYLLDDFPGRWDGGALWVEAQGEQTATNERRSRRSDGVSSILITSNDFASAWAQDDRRRPLFPVVPGGDVQREMAYRAGVNIVMYALTGNYKADQVHIPALLERLGQ